MNLEFRQHKQAIRSFMQLHYTDERLAQLLAHAQSGRLSYVSCCCFIGVANADHALQGENKYISLHCINARLLPGAIEAEVAFLCLFKYGPWARNPSARRLRILIPMIRAEIRRRDQSKPVGDYCDVHQEAVR